MGVRAVYSIAGVFVGATVNVLVSLLTAAIQKRAFADQFSRQSMWWLVGLSVGGLLLGYWLGAKIQVPIVPAAGSSVSRQPVTMTRLSALISYIKLRGKGINLTDVLTIGSRIDIDTREK